MGLIVNVFRCYLGDCTNGGASSTVDTVCVVNIPGPFEPGPDRPAFELVHRPENTHAILRPVNSRLGIGPMFGGNFGYSSDSRFSEAVRNLTGLPNYGAVHIHDRFETPEQYEILSR